MLQRIGTELKPAWAYLRGGTSIAERNAIRAFATRFGFEIVAELKQSHSPASPPQSRAGIKSDLAALLTRVNMNAVRAVIVGSASLFADAAIERVVGYDACVRRVLSS